LIKVISRLVTELTTNIGTFFDICCLLITYSFWFSAFINTCILMELVLGLLFNEYCWNKI